MTLFRKKRKPDDAGIPVRLHQAHAGAVPQPRDATTSASAERDVVIGAVSGYSFPDIQYWVNSLNRSGYAGRRAVIAYDATFDLVDELVGRGFEVMTFAEDRRRRRFIYPQKGFRPEDTSINRFYQMWRFLQSQAEPFRFVVAADTRDVVFQRDPAAWLEEHLGEMGINVASEGATVADESWSSEVILESYGPIIHKNVSARDVYNAGTIAGRGEVMKDLALNVFLCSRYNAISYTDQAALNILLSLEPYRSITRFNAVDDDWACQAATVASGSEYLAGLGRHATSLAPVFDGEFVYTCRGGKYCMVHQYDRVPEWKARLQVKYAD